MAGATRVEDADKPRSSTQAVERSLAILECFRGDTGDLGISEIARTVGINVSTAHRIARALRERRFLEQDDRTERYRLGRTIAALGQRASQRLGFELAVPELERLAELTGESSSLSVPEGTEVLVVLCSPSAQRLRFDHTAGSLVPGHASAMGKAMLAYAGNDARATVATYGNLVRFTPHTVTSKAKLTAELEQVRHDGFAVNREERYVGVVGVAAPILDATGVARAAIGIQGPSARLTDQRVAAIAQQVAQSASALARELPLDRF